MKLKTITAAAALLLIGAGATYLSAPANAQYGDPWHNNVRFRGAIGGPPAIRWRGSVDDRVELFIRGGDIHSHAVSGKGIDNEDAEVQAPLPPDHVRVFVEHYRGRGQVYVFQQPRRDNDFTAGVRIYDPEPGRGNYSVTLGWE